MSRISLLLILSVSPLLTFAQQRQRDTSRSESPTTVVIGTLKVNLKESEKIETIPVLDKTPVKPTVFSYNIKSKQVKTDKIVKPIPVADLNVKEEHTFPTSFVKMGYGNMKTPLFEAYLNNKQDPKFSYGMHYRFLQTNSDLNHSFADYTNHAFKGYFSTYTEAGEFGLEVNYKLSKYNFYGYVDTNKEAEKHLGRVVNSFDANAYFNSTAISARKLKHRTQFNFYNFQIGNARENQYALKSKLYGNISGFRDLKDGLLSADLGLDYNTFQNDTFGKLNRLFIQVDPRFDFLYEGMHITAGFNTTFFVSGDTTKTFVNPVIKASYPLVPSVADIYVGIDGRYHKQSLRNIILTNPFVSQYNLVNMYENVRLFAGLTAKIGSSADALFEINYSDISKMPLYISTGDSLNSFTIRYAQVNMLKFTAAFNYSFSEKVRIGVLGNFYNYETTGETNPWQLPNIDGKLNMKFNIKNKVYPHFDIIAMGVQKQRTGLNDAAYNTNTIRAFYDISAGIDYRFKKKLSLFVQANNMLANRYQRWYNYPVYGFNIIGGLTFIF